MTIETLEKKLRPLEAPVDHELLRWLYLHLPPQPIKTKKMHRGYGEAIRIRVAFKPTATIGREQETVNTARESVTLAARGRHDPCVLPRAVPMVEAMVALVLVDHYLRQRAIAGE